MLSIEDGQVIGLATRTRQSSAVSQALRAIRDSIENGVSAWDIGDEGDDLPGYRVRVAADGAARERAFRLAHRIYETSGYAPADATCTSRSDASGNSFTLLAEDGGGHEVATATLVFDSPEGLPCDEIYQEETAHLRQNGSKPVEVTRLAIAPNNPGSKLLLLRLFNFSYIYARRVRGFTDFLIEVNPRHVDYYRKLLLFRVIGPERTCPRVNGAPAILMRTPLDTPDLPGVRKNEQTLYPRFYSWLEEGAVAEFLAAAAGCVRKS